MVTRMRRPRVILKVSGDAAKLQRIAEAAKNAGKADGAWIKREVRAALKKAAGPVLVKQKANAKALPGIPSELKTVAARMAGVQVRYGKSTAGVRLRVSKRKGRGLYARDLNRGRLRHPLFGNREYWYEQKTTPGWFDRPAEAARDDVHTAISNAIDGVLDKFKI